MHAVALIFAFDPVTPLLALVLLIVAGVAFVVFSSTGALVERRRQTKDESDKSRPEHLAVDEPGRHRQLMD